MIAVIVPVFNSEKTLLRCLESVDSAAQQADNVVELVIVFDGPNDACEEIVRNWQPTSNTTLRKISMARTGIAAARNAGAQAAQSNVITFLDADDELLPARLHYASACPELQLAIGQQRIVGESSMPPGLHPSVGDGGLSPYLTSMVLTRRTLQLLGGFSGELSLGDDWDLVVRAREAGVAITIVNEVWAVRHIHESNASRDVNGLSRDYLRVIRHHLHWSREDLLKARGDDGKKEWSREP